MGTHFVNSYKENDEIERNLQQSCEHKYISRWQDKGIHHRGVNHSQGPGLEILESVRRGQKSITWIFEVPAQTNFAEPKNIIISLSY